MPTIEKAKAEIDFLAKYAELKQLHATDRLPIRTRPVSFQVRAPDRRASS